MMLRRTTIARKKDDARDLALLCARIADDRKGERILVLKMTDLLAVTDYFVIASGNNRRHVQAIADEIGRTLKKRDLRCLSMEGHAEAPLVPRSSGSEGTWVLLDYGDVVVHVFDEGTRAFYDLEHLWADAPRARWRDAGTVPDSGDCPPAEISVRGTVPAARWRPIMRKKDKT